MAMRKPTGGGDAELLAYYVDMSDGYRKVLNELIDDIEATGGIRLIGGIWAPVACPFWTDIAATYIHACEALGRVPVDYEHD